MRAGPWGARAVRGPRRHAGMPAPRGSSPTRVPPPPCRRSFAVVIQQLPNPLRDAICVFYLVLRGLDTVEDDMAIPVATKVPELKAFHQNIYDRCARPLPALRVPCACLALVWRVRPPPRHAHHPCGTRPLTHAGAST